MNKNQAVNFVISLLPKNRIFLLTASLGVGKTTFVKSLSKKLKIKDKVISPTFIIWQKYNFKFKDKDYVLNHIDLYRLRTRDILKLDFEQELKKRKNIFFIEWGEKLKKFLARKKINFIEIIIKINKVKNNSRIFIIKK
jgi:tRNA threonylcarbamoyladenosine biosynthesis protein TsaE